MRRACVAGALLLAAVSACAILRAQTSASRGATTVRATESARYKATLERLVAALNAGDFAKARQDFSEPTWKDLPPEKTATFFKELMETYGSIRKVDDPEIKPTGAVFVAQFERGVLDVKIALDGQDKVIGLLFLPHVPDLPVPQRNQAKLRLPFRGEWRVFWGGDTKEQNQHHDVPNQRFAFDFVAVDDAGSDHLGSGQRNEDYFAFAKEVLAPADGNVTDVIEGVRDNAPGSMNPYSALGNALVTEHGAGEFSVLAHLKLGSIRVKPGERIRAGQMIGLCGNSGNSSQPHVHFHIQNTPVIQDGKGVRCVFEALSLRQGREKQTKKDCSPIRGEVVVGD